MEGGGGGALDGRTGPGVTLRFGGGLVGSGGRDGPGVIDRLDGARDEF